jgi:hypothetical protein
MPGSGPVIDGVEFKISDIGGYSLLCREGYLETLFTVEINKFGKELFPDKLNFPLYHDLDYYSHL